MVLDHTRELGPRRYQHWTTEFGAIMALHPGHWQKFLILDRMGVADGSDEDFEDISDEDFENRQPYYK